ncbi:unnamed protein product [Calypogeia fissa]
MATEGVPAKVGMQISGHKTEGAYSRYDRSTKAQVTAAQRSAADGTHFIYNYKDEAALLKEVMVQGGQLTEKRNNDASYEVIMHESVEIVSEKVVIKDPSARKKQGSEDMKVEMSKSCADSKSSRAVDAMAIMNVDLLKESKVQDSTSRLDMKDKKGLDDYDCFLESLDWEALSKESWATSMAGACIVKSVIGKVDGLTRCTLSNCIITIHVRKVERLQLEHPHLEFLEADASTELCNCGVYTYVSNYQISPVAIELLQS